MVADKLSSALQFVDEVLLHVSRGVRWDSDHVVLLTDEIEAIAQEIVRGDYLDRVHIGLDFFDASINRVAAWVIGTRAMIKALLLALLEPIDMLRKFEAENDYTVAAGAAGGAEDAPLGRGLGQVPRQPRDPRRPRLARRREEVRGRRVEQAGVEKPSQSCFSPRENVPRRGG